MREQKKDYKKPQLKAYGSLKDITAFDTCQCEVYCFIICYPADYPDSGGTCPRTLGS